MLTVILTLATLQNNQSWTKEEALKHLAPGVQVEKTQAWSYLSTLSYNDKEVRIASLRYWAENHENIRAACQSLIVEREDYATFTYFLDNVGAGVDLCAADVDPAIAKEGLRTLCALSTHPAIVIPESWLCGTGMEYSLSYYIWERLDKRAKGSTQELLALVDDPNPTVVFNALRELPVGEHETLRPKLVAMLKSKDWLFRGMAIYFLHYKTDKDLVAAMEPMLLDEDSNVRETASQKIQRCTKDKPAAIRNYARFSPQMRAEIVEFVEKSEREDRTQWLVAAMGDKAQIVRERAIRYLLSSTSEPTPLTEPQLRALLSDPSQEVRYWSLRELFLKEVPDGRELALAALRDPAIEVRDTGADYLGEHFDVSLTPHVIAALELGLNKIYAVDRYIVHPSNAQHMLAWLGSRNTKLRDGVIEAIYWAKAGDTFLDLLIAHSATVDSEDCGKLINALGTSKHPRAVQRLIELAQKFEDLQSRVIDVFYENQTEETRAFVTEMLKSKDRRVRDVAKGTLHHWDNPDGEEK